MKLGKKVFSVFFGFGNRKNVLEAEIWCPNCKEHMDARMDRIGDAPHRPETQQFYYDVVCENCHCICTSLLLREIK